MGGELVLVTGGSGFVGAHAIVRLLNSGYRVRTTVRSLSRVDAVRDAVRAGGTEPGERLSFAEADLTSDEGWSQAHDGCSFVLHVASPFPASVPNNEDDLIVPARDGAVRVLRAARDAGVTRVVLTSSFAAIGYGTASSGPVFTEEDWTDVDGPHVSAYAKSKTLAERAAWDFIAREGGSLELAVVNPVAIFGPVLGSDLSSSVELLRRVLTGSMSVIPQAFTNVVDVRDVIDLHLRAMTSPSASGQRFLAVAGPPMGFPEIAQLLRSRLGEAASRVPTRTLPDWLARVGALFSPELKSIAPQLGISRAASNDKAKSLLGWLPRSNEDALVASAESLLLLGLLEGSRRY